MNIRLMRLIQAALLVEPARIELTAGIRVQPHPFDPETQPRCGTCGCIAGWAVMLGHLVGEDGAARQEDLLRTYFKARLFNGGLGPHISRPGPSPWGRAVPAMGFSGHLPRYAGGLLGLSYPIDTLLFYAFSPHVARNSLNTLYTEKEARNLVVNAPIDEIDAILRVFQQHYSGIERRMDMLRGELDTLHGEMQEEGEAALYHSMGQKRDGLRRALRAEQQALAGEVSALIDQFVKWFASPLDEDPGPLLHEDAVRPEAILQRLHEAVTDRQQQYWKTPNHCEPLPPLDPHS